jgi:sugar transferase (PEP-CTERM system associated)
VIRLFRVFVPTSTLTLLISESFLITAGFLVAWYVEFPADPTAHLLYEGGLFNISLVLVSMLIALYLQDLYSDIYVKSSITLAQQLCLVGGTALLTQGMIAYLQPGLRMPVHVLALGGSISLAALFVWRHFFASVAIQVVGRDRLLLIGESPLLEDIARHVEAHPEQAIQVAGYVDDSAGSNDVRPGGKVLGGFDRLREIVEATDPTRIVVGMSERRNRVPVSALLELRFAGHIIEEAGAAFERVCGQVSIKELRPSQLIYTGELGPRRSSLFYQTLSNVVLATVGIVLGAPLMLLTAFAVRVSSPGPILYRQVRVGLDGKPFTLFKFRSMREDAEASTGAVWAAKDDPRVTGVGRIIRRLRFDELPQLLNVLRGEMSMVGPRPERPEFVKLLTQQIPYYRQRHSVRPGITGWAQINYKYGDTLEDTIKKLEYDLYYIKNMSLSMDVLIMFHTIKAMLLFRGAQ